MRLLHAKTLEFKVFHDNHTPQYLILSHTWGNEEVTYQEMRFLQQQHALPDSLKSNSLLMAALEAAAGLKISAADSKPIHAHSGYLKIQMTAKLARKMRLEYFWIDTACIDKSSSAELQEAINSMYRWYQQSSFCIVYLEDADTVRTPGSELSRRPEIAAKLRAFRWITRGWTLQELIAPKRLSFYDRHWEIIGSKNTLSPIVAKVTGIPLSVLHTGDLMQSSVAQKMSWAANRKTTRAEDRAYSLMGLFGIHMPMLYGEGDNAFRRLQEEIMRTTPDDSIFAWRTVEGSLSGYCGLLAKSPDDFERSQHVTKGRAQFASSNLGLTFETGIHPVLGGTNDEVWDDSIFALWLKAWESTRPFPTPIALLVRRLSSTHYTRVATETFKTSRHRMDNGHGSFETLYVEHTPNIDISFQSRAMCYFQFKVDPQIYRIGSAHPERLWDPIHNDLSISSECSTNNTSDKNESRGRSVFYGTVRLYRRSEDLCLVCSIYVGHDFSTGQVWFRLLDSYSTPTEKRWRSECQERLGGYHPTKSAAPPSQVLRISEFESVRMRVLPGIHRGMISHIVTIHQEQDAYPLYVPDAY
jgi:hypothetical protein